jgi:hypothetical protein
MGSALTEEDKKGPTAQNEACATAKSKNLSDSIMSTFVSTFFVFGRGFLGANPRFF